MNLLRKNEKIYQIVRYAVVGLSNNGLIYLIYLLITYLGADPKLAITILYPIAILFAFICHLKYSFEFKGKIKMAMGRYLSSYFICYCLNYVILFIFIDKYKFSHQLVEALSIFFIGGVLFFMLKYFVFVIPNSLKEVK